MEYCIKCAGKLVQIVPEGDNRKRHVCSRCHHIHYVNPKIIVGATCFYEDKILLCKRAIEPRSGFWTIPAGFLENKETTEQGAQREAYEEATITIETKNILVIYDIPHISQIQIIYFAIMKQPSHSPGIESLETTMVSENEVPYKELAFPTVTSAIKLGFERLKNPNQPFRHEIIEPKLPGTH